MPHAGIQHLPAKPQSQTSGCLVIRLGCSIGVPTNFHWKSAGSIPVPVLHQDEEFVKCL